MKNILFIAAVILGLAAFTSCEKCYRCENECKVCSYAYPDTTLTIQVCSDVLAEQYFGEYIDSITSPSLGWVCRDTTANKSVHFCGGQSSNEQELINKKAEGYRCAAE